MKQKIKFYWDDSTNLKGEPIRIRKDENGTRIPKKDWDNYDFEEIDHPDKKPKRKVITFSHTIDNNKLAINDSEGKLSFLCQSSKLPYCCGMHEIGNFVTGYKEASEVPQEFAKYLDTTFKEYVAKISKFNAENNHKIELIMNLRTDELACQMMRDSIETTGEFIIVKEFININTGRKIEFYTTSN